MVCFMRLPPGNSSCQFVHCTYDWIRTYASRSWTYNIPLGCNPWYADDETKKIKQRNQRVEFGKINQLSNRTNKIHKGGVKHALNVSNCKKQVSSKSYHKCKEKSTHQILDRGFHIGEISFGECSGNHKVGHIDILIVEMYCQEVIYHLQEKME